MANTHQQSKARVKSEDAIKLRAAGWTFQQVADRINEKYGTKHSADYVQKMVTKALRNAPVEGIEDLRRLEAHRLDSMQARLITDFNRPTPALVWETTQDGDRQLASIDLEGEDKIMRTRARIADTLLKLHERRAKLFGIDALPADAAPVDVTVQFSPTVAPQPMTEAVVDIPRDAAE